MNEIEIVIYVELRKIRNSTRQDDYLPIKTSRIELDPQYTDSVILKLNLKVDPRLWERTFVSPQISIGLPESESAIIDTLKETVKDLEGPVA